MVNINTSNNDPLKVAHFFLTECVEIFCFLGLAVFLEILELRFCGLDNNIKKAIIEKGNEEFRKSIHNLEDFNEDEDDDDEDNCNNEDEEKNNKDNNEKNFIGPYRNI